jgi:hypothetical protein
LLYNPWLFILLLSCHCIATLAQYLPWYIEFFVSLLLLENASLFCLLDKAFSLTHFISLVVSFILTLLVHDYLISLLATNKYVWSNSLIILTQLLDFIIFFYYSKPCLTVCFGWMSRIGLCCDGMLWMSRIELCCASILDFRIVIFVPMIDLLLCNDCWCIVWLLSIMASVYKVKP